MKERGRRSLCLKRLRPPAACRSLLASPMTVAPRTLHGIEWEEVAGVEEAVGEGRGDRGKRRRMLGKARCSPKVPCAHVLLGSPASQLRKFRDGAGSGRRWSREWTSAWPRLLADPWSSSPDLGLDREEVGCRWLDPGRRDPSLPPRPRSAFTDPGRALGGFEMGRPPVRTVAFLSSLLTGPVRATLLREDPASLLDRGSPTAAGSREHRRQGGGGAVGGQEEAEGPRRAALDADRGGARGWLEKGKERETSGMRVGEVVPSFLGKGWGIVGGAIMPFHSSFWGWGERGGHC